MNYGIIVDEISNSSDIGYSPSQIRTAYKIKNKFSGNDVTVALIDFIGNPNIQNNLDIFSDEFGLPHTNVTRVNEMFGKNKFEYSAYIEPVIDAQWVHAISPAADLVVVGAYEYTVEGAVDAIRKAVEINADIILQTFQAPFIEKYLDYSDIFENDAVFVASAGDYGYGAYFPSCFPRCVSVGGTSLKIDKDGNRLGNEIVWSGTGGGICEYFSIPEYQRKLEPINKITSGKRGVPDVSFLADPGTGYTVYHSSFDDVFGWYRAGGTSIAAAVIAGIIANIISSSIISDKKDLLPKLYELAGGRLYTNPYNSYIDIKEGNNGRYVASEGYDLCTGLGSMINF